MGNVLLLSFTAALNPTLLAASTIMLLLPHPKRLFLGYLLGAMMTSITLGLLIVFSLEGSSSATSTAQNTVNPAADFVLGVILLVVAFVLHTDRDARLQERRQRRKAAKEPKGPSRTEQLLGRGSARITFAVGAVLTLPGASYLAALHDIAAEDLSTAATVATVLGFNLIMLMLLELPLLGYVFAPDWTPGAVERFKAWIGRNSRRLAIRGCVALGVLCIATGAITVLT